jgi:secretion/DNA translocation related TadE-like protein
VQGLPAAKTPNPARDERGSGSALGLAVIATTIALMLLVVPLYTVFAARARASAAADAAALAAADVAIGILPGSPCSLAASVAEANGAVLTECRPDGVIVTVRVSVGLPDGGIAGLEVQETATAGPPGSGAG